MITAYNSINTLEMKLAAVAKPEMESKTYFILLLANMGAGEESIIFSNTFSGIRVTNLGA